MDPASGTRAMIGVHAGGNGRAILGRTSQARSFPLKRPLSRICPNPIGNLIFEIRTKNPMSLVATAWGRR